MSRYKEVYKTQSDKSSSTPMKKKLSLIRLNEMWTFNV